jgi:hypothetical protein
MSIHHISIYIDIHTSIYTDIVQKLFTDVRPSLGCYRPPPRDPPPVPQTSLLGGLASPQTPAKINRATKASLAVYSAPTPESRQEIPVVLPNQKTATKQRCAGRLKIRPSRPESRTFLCLAWKENVRKPTMSDLDRRAQSSSHTQEPARPETGGQGNNNSENEGKQTITAETEVPWLDLDRSGHSGGTTAPGSAGALFYAAQKGPAKAWGFRCFGLGPGRSGGPRKAPRALRGPPRVFRGASRRPLGPNTNQSKNT